MFEDDWFDNVADILEGRGGKKGAGNLNILRFTFWHPIFPVLLTSTNPQLVLD